MHDNGSIEPGVAAFIAAQDAGRQAILMEVRKAVVKSWMGLVV